DQSPVAQSGRRAVRAGPEQRFDLARRQDRCGRILSRVARIHDERAKRDSSSSVKTRRMSRTKMCKTRGRSPSQAGKNSSARSLFGNTTGFAALHSYSFVIELRFQLYAGTSRVTPIRRSALDWRRLTNAR